MSALADSVATADLLTYYSESPFRSFTMRLVYLSALTLFASVYADGCVPNYDLHCVAMDPNQVNDFNCRNQCIEIGNNCNGDLNYVTCLEGAGDCALSECRCICHFQ